MPTVTFRVSERERDQLRRDAQVQDKSVSGLVREALRGEGGSGDLEGRLEDLERRIARLEGVAGLD